MIHKHSSKPHRSINLNFFSISLLVIVSDHNIDFKKIEIFFFFYYNLVKTSWCIPLTIYDTKCVGTVRGDWISNRKKNWNHKDDYETVDWIYEPLLHSGHSNKLDDSQNFIGNEKYIYQSALNKHSYPYIMMEFTSIRQVRFLLLFQWNLKLLQKKKRLNWYKL